MTTFPLGHAEKRALNKRFLASIWTIPAVVLPILGATLAWLSFEDYEQTLEQEYRLLEAHARIAEGQLSGLVRNIKQLIRRIAEERPTLPTPLPASYAVQLAERNREIPEIRTLALVDATGHVELAVDPVLKGFDGSKREYYTAHHDHVLAPNFHVSRPFKSYFGDYSITFSVAIRDDRQQFRGVAVAGIHYQYFGSVMQQIRPPGAGSATALINEYGDVLYRLPDPEQHVGTSIAAGEPFKEFIRGSQKMSRSIGVANIDGVKRIYVFRAIDGTQLAVAVARPFDDAFAAWHHNLVLRVALFGIVAAITLRLALIARRRQQDVMASQEFSDMLIETANAIVIGIDAQARIIVVNEAAERIFGYRRDELLGRSWFETLMPRTRYPKAWVTFRAYAESNTIPRAFETPILTKDGQERIIAWQNSAIKAGKAITAIYSFGIDVTEREMLAQARYQEDISRRLVAIHEEERRRLAVELYDRANPNLSVLDINFRLLADSLPAQASPDFANLLEDTSATLADTIASIRAISTDFRSPLLDYAGLWPALQGYARQFSRRTGIEVETTDQPLEWRLAPDVETSLFRIVQEALTNCAKHSQAQKVSITHRRTDRGIELAVSDDGVGFDADTGAQNYGLMTMCQRAKFIGGRLDIETQPGRGTRIAVSFRATTAVVLDPA